MPQLDYYIFFMAYTQLYETNFIFCVFCLLLSFAYIIICIFLLKNKFNFFFFKNISTYFYLFPFFKLPNIMQSPVFFNFFSFFSLYFMTNIGFQEPGSTAMLAYIVAHNNAFEYLTIIFCTILWIFSVIIYQSYTPINFIDLDINNIKFNELVNNFDHCSTLEFLWTVLPSIYLENCGASGIAFVYASTEFPSDDSPDTVLKIMGHQWYWDYDYSGFQDMNGRTVRFSSNLQDKKDTDLDPNIQGSFRSLLEVTERVALPMNTRIKVLISSADVIHSWSVPGLGVKVDAIPGRLNQIEFTITKYGIFRGQCSEFCGVGHGFMPIVVQSCNVLDYWSYLITKATNQNLENYVIYENNMPLEFGTLDSNFWRFYFWRFFECSFWSFDSDIIQKKSLEDFIAFGEQLKITIPSIGWKSEFMHTDFGSKAFYDIVHANQAYAQNVVNDFTEINFERQTKLKDEILDAIKTYRTLNLTDLFYNNKTFESTSFYKNWIENLDESSLTAYNYRIDKTWFVDLILSFEEDTIMLSKLLHYIQLYASVYPELKINILSSIPINFKDIVNMVDLYLLTHEGKLSSEVKEVLETISSRKAFFKNTNAYTFIGQFLNFLKSYHSNNETSTEDFGEFITPFVQPYLDIQSNLNDYTEFNALDLANSITESLPDMCRGGIKEKLLEVFSSNEAFSNKILAEERFSLKTLYDTPELADNVIEVLNSVTSQKFYLSIFIIDYIKTVMHPRFETGIEIIPKIEATPLDSVLLSSVLHEPGKILGFYKPIDFLVELTDDKEISNYISIKEIDLLLNKYVKIFQSKEFVAEYIYQHQVYFIDYDLHCATDYYEKYVKVEIIENPISNKLRLDFFAKEHDYPGYDYDIDFLMKWRFICLQSLVTNDLSSFFAKPFFTEAYLKFNFSQFFVKKSDYYNPLSLACYSIEVLKLLYKCDKD